MMRAELSPAERARATARCKALHEELHPEARHGRNTKESGQVGHSSFAKATAAATGTSKRAVRRDAERGEKITDAALAKVVGTTLNTGAYLDKLRAPHKTRDHRGISLWARRRTGRFVRGS